MEYEGSLFALGDERENSISYHSIFLNNWKRTLQRDVKSGQNERWIEYGNGKKAYVISDLSYILKELNRHPDNVEKNRLQFKFYAEKQPYIILDEMPDTYTWYNTTDRGINLRPGKKEDSVRVPKPVLMEGEKSHAIVAGQTGSGKSVFLNSMILNLMTEYPPWELELYLADFKKVEFSRYMNKYKAPHVRACAATSEIEYVKSLIQYIKEKNDDRGNLFARMGFQKIEDFRSYFRITYDMEIVLPRILFIVDEFQQMYLDVDSFQKDAINDLLTSIIKTGRSQGVHLIFCSQELSGSLNSQQMANFKLHFALHCNAEISSDILGNTAAKDIRRGQVILNAKSNYVEDNEIYTVPLAEDPKNQKQEEDYFYRLLKKFSEYASKMQYFAGKNQKFYNEDQQCELSDLKKILENPAIRKIRMFDGDGEEDIRECRENFMKLVLGRKTTYTSEKYDIESLYVDYAKNRCLLCVSPNNADLAYFQKLLAVNLQTMDSETDSMEQMNRRFNVPEFFDLNPLVSTLYPVEDRMRDLGYLSKQNNNSENLQEREMFVKVFEDENVHYRTEELEMLWEIYSDRKETLDELRNADSVKCFLVERIRKYLNEMEGFQDREVQDKFVEGLIDTYLDDLENNAESLLAFLKKDLSFFGDEEAGFREDLIRYYRYKFLKNCPTHKIFRPMVVYISGIENIEQLPCWFSEYLSNCMNYNIFTAVFSTAGVRYEIREAANFVFVSGDNVRIFEEYAGKRPPKGGSGIKFFCTVKNRNQQFAFKKYRCKLNEQTAHAINFDAYLD